MLKIYNTLTNTEEDFVPIEEGTVRMYTCGPTVYGRPHIGNYSSFLMADLLRRWLEVSGYEVTHVKNITDVGHLAGDDTADATGEDKIERQAAQENVDPLDIARKYTEEYLADEQALNLLEPHHRPRATEVVPGMLEMVRTLLDKGHAYETDDGFYFSVESCSSYGKLSGNTLENLQSGARISVDENKKHPADFALWKKCVGDNAHHLLRWSFATGERLSGAQEDPEAGFPGWHIECSVMSSQLLGDHFDVHTGGEDLIFPHHECEIAQSESFSGEKSVNYWMHKKFIDLGDTKMSKSLGNVLSIPDIQDMGYSPLDLRYLLLSVHYRTPLKFTEEGLDAAKKARKRIMEWIEDGDLGFEIWDLEPGVSQSSRSTSQVQQYADAFHNAMNADLNTPAALAVIFDVMSWSRTTDLSDDDKEALGNFIAMIRHTFGCFEPEQDCSIPDEVQQLLDERQAARDSKDFVRSDEIRDALRDMGWEVRDEGGGQVLKRL